LKWTRCTIATVSYPTFWIAIAAIIVCKDEMRSWRLESSVYGKK
jgi:hypothetical protein